MNPEDATVAVANVAQTVTSTVHAMEGADRHPVVSFLSAFLWLFGTRHTATFGLRLIKPLL